MKQRAKVYKGKRVVMGDKNRVTKHEIHVNDIPQEGGNSGGGGEESVDTMEYFIAKDAPQLSSYLSTVKMSFLSGEIIQIMPFIPQGAGLVEQGEILAFGVDFQARSLAVTNVEKVDVSMLDVIIEATGLTADQIAAIPRITKEDFFTLPKDVTVKYRDQEKLKEVYEGIVDLYIRRGLPIYDNRTREAVFLDEPLVYFNYKFLGIEYNEFGDMYTPTHLLLYGKGQQGYPGNHWDESFSESEDISYDYLEFNDCYIFKVTLPNGEVVYTFKGIPV